MRSNEFSEGRRSLCVPESQGRRPWTTFLLLLAVLFPAIASFGILYYQGLSVPYQDDYDAILLFAVDYDHLPDFKTKLLDIAAAQHNEYKLAFEHSIIASELELTHHLNFRFLTAFGNCFVLAIAFLLWLTFSGAGDLRSRLARFLPISFVFFSLTYWENLDWVMTELQNIPVVLFSLLAIYLLVRAESTRAVFAACVAAALAAFTSANGFLLGPVGLLYLMARRRYARAVTWCASFILPLAGYLYHYVPFPHELNRRFYLTRPLFFFAFLGSAIQSRWVAALLGIAVLAVTLFAVHSRFDKIDPVAFWFAMWIVATAGLVAWVRGGGGFLVTSRYSIYSILMLIFCCTFLARYLAGRPSELGLKRFYLASLVVAFGLWLMGNISAFTNLGKRRQMVLTGIELYRSEPEVNSPMIDPQVSKVFPREKKLEQIILTRAIQEGVYTLPPKQQVRFHP